MKLYIFIVAILSLFGCATTIPTTQSSIPVDLKITVESANDAVVKVEEKESIKYKLPDNPYIKPSSLMILSKRNKDIAFLKIFSGLSVADVRNIWNDTTYLHHETDISKVILFINSPGGDAFAGLALADLIIRAQKEYGITFEAHASGIIASAAVPPFVVCEKRYAAPGTIFMVHEAALWKWPGRESASTISAQNDLMKLLQKRYIAYLLPPRSKLGFDEWALLEKNTTWFDAVKARDEYGIVDIIE